MIDSVFVVQFEAVVAAIAAVAVAAVVAVVVAVVEVEKRGSVDFAYKVVFAAVVVLLADNIPEFKIYTKN